MNEFQKQRELSQLPLRRISSGLRSPASQFRAMWKMTTVLTVAALLGLTSYSRSQAAQPTTKVQSGTVQGQAVDHRGKPLAGIHVWIKPGLTTGVVDITTGTDGRYRADGLPYLPYTAHAWYPVSAYGKTYCYRLAHPTAAEHQPFNAQQGTTRNFKWQLSGKIPGKEDYRGSGYYGGTLTLLASSQDGGSLLNNEDRLEVTLTPDGPLIDGSAGKKLILKTNELSHIYDIPVGKYRASAVAVTPTGSRQPVLLAAEYRSAASPSTTFTFDGLRAGESCVGTLSGWTATRSLYYFLPARP